MSCMKGNQSRIIAAVQPLEWVWIRAGSKDDSRID